MDVKFSVISVDEGDGWGRVRERGRGGGRDVQVERCGEGENWGGGVLKGLGFDIDGEIRADF